MTMIEIDALKSATQVVLAAAGKSYIDIFKPEGTLFNPPLVYFYTDPVEGFFNLFVVESGGTTPVYLPNWLAELIQLATNQQLTVLVMRDIQEWTYEFLKIFKTLCQMRATLWWWLMFNPYQQPFNTLRVLTEWYLTAFIGIFPVIIGIDIGSTMGLALLGHSVDLLGRLAFTVPYLPKEGELIKAADLSTIDNPNLSEMLTEYGKDVRIINYSKISEEYYFMNHDNIFEHYDSEKHDEWIKSIDLVIIFDVGDYKRIRTLCDAVSKYNLKIMNIEVSNYFWIKLKDNSSS